MSESLNAADNPDKPSLTDVVRVGDIDLEQLQQLLHPYDLSIECVEADQEIPGSFWGDEEAGLIGKNLYARPDTPIHSVLHEACHYICMDDKRRKGLNTNAGGDYDEENGVCYLQILLADLLPPLNKSRLMADMDSWGYSFRLGTTQKWFEQDAEDARNWLIKYGIISGTGKPTWKLSSVKLSPPANSDERST